MKLVKPHKTLSPSSLPADKFPRRLDAPNNSRWTDKLHCTLKVKPVVNRSVLSVSDLASFKVLKWKDDLCTLPIYTHAHTYIHTLHFKPLTKRCIILDNISLWSMHFNKDPRIQSSIKIHLSRWTWLRIIAKRA